MNFEEEDFEFKKILSQLKRQFQILKEGNIQERKKVISEIENYINEYKLDLESFEMEDILLEFSKNLLEAFSDNIDKVRETSIRLMRVILSRVENADQHLKYIFSILVSRTNCHDLEGVEGLPEQMLPHPTQKPQLMKDVVEKSEVARMELLELTATLIECLSEEAMRVYINDTINLVRVFLMDPFDKIQIKACRVASELVTRFKPLIYHFTVLMSRAILLPLVSRKSAVKIAALQTLYDTLHCGTWKYTVDVFDVLVGFRDPNYVPIKDFYQSTHRLNYFALFINHKNVTVREAFLRFMGDILMYLPDRADVKARVFPYVLTGLFDEHKSIQETCIEVMEEIGLVEEREKEIDFREAKQMGYDAEWTFDGRLGDLPLPPPFKKRPRLGSRSSVRNELAKIVPPIRRELKDGINLRSRYKATRLLQVMLIYAEEYVVEYLDVLIPQLLKIFSTGDQEEFAKETKESIGTCLSLIGRFCSFKSFNTLIEKYLNFEISQNEEMLINALIGYKHIISGYLEALPENDGFQHKKESVEEIIEKLGETNWLDNLSRYSLPKYHQLFVEIFVSLDTKAKETEIEEILFSRAPKVARIILSILSIPIFNLFNDERNKINMRLIKKNIDSTNSLKNDESAKIMLKLLNTLQSRNEELLYDLITDIEDSEVSKDSNNALVIFSAFNYALSQKNAELFRAVVLKMESSMLENENFFHSISYFINYFSFFTKENFSTEERKNFLEIFIGFNIRFVISSLKSHFSSIFGSNDEYDGDNEPRISNSIYFSTLDITSSNLKNTRSKFLKYVNKDTVAELFLSLTFFMLVEKSHERKIRWMRVINKLLTSCNKEQLSNWLSEAKIEKKDFEGNRRLWRYFSECKDVELAIQVVITKLFDCYRALDLGNSDSKVFTNNALEWVSLCKVHVGGVKKEFGEEKNFLYCVDILVQICLNEKDVNSLKVLRNTLVQVCKRYKNSFSKLLVDAEKDNRPVRLQFLNKIWNESE